MYAIVIGAAYKNCSVKQVLLHEKISLQFFHEDA